MTPVSHQTKKISRFGDQSNLINNINLVSNQRFFFSRTFGLCRIRINSRFVSIDDRFSAVYIILIRLKSFSINVVFYFLSTGLTPQEMSLNRAILGLFLSLHICYKPNSDAIVNTFLAILFSDGIETGRDWIKEARVGLLSTRVVT